MTRISMVRQIGLILAGYLVVGLLVVFFLAISGHAKEWFGLPAPLSEATALTIAAVLTAPLFLPFVLKRISKVKLGNLEVDLVQVSEQVEEKLAIELVSVEIKRGLSEKREISDLEKISEISKIWVPSSPLTTAIKEAETTGIIEVNLGTGSSWLSTRLFLLAALAEDYTGINQMIFLENRQGQERVFVGGSTPAAVRQGMASNNPRLAEMYETSKQAFVTIQGHYTPEEKVAFIAETFVYNLDPHQGEEGMQEWVTSQFLDRHSEMNKYCIEWNGGASTNLLLYQILDCVEPFVFLVTSTRQLSLVIDRLKLSEQVALNYLRQQLDQ